MESAPPWGYASVNAAKTRTTGFLTARRILTLDPAHSGDAIWWEDGRIRRVGTAAQLARAVPRGTPSYELPDALVTPGFVDGHTHFALWALGRRRVQLAGCASRDDAIRRVAQATPMQGWVIGQGWDANNWEHPPERATLDAVQAGPVYLDSLDVHAAWVNSAALAAAGIARETREPFGGRIVRDGAGEPTGLLLERAVELMLPHLPEPPSELLDAALLDAQEEAHRLGITGIHNMEGDPVLAAFERLATADALRLRVLFHPPVATLPDLVRRGIRSGSGSGWLRIGGVKLFLDGSLGSGTAWMLEPYAGSRDRGMPITTARVAAAAMRMAADAGIAVSVHAIGDAAVRRALDLMTPLPAVGMPHRIEHFQCVHPDDLGRAAAAGIVVSMQPAHLLTDIPLVERHWGARGRGAYAFGPCCGEEPGWSSAATRRSPRSIRVKASTPRWSGGVRPAPLWRLASRGETGFRGGGARLHARCGARGWASGGGRQPGAGLGRRSGCMGARCRRRARLGRRRPGGPGALTVVRGEVVMHR